MAKTPIKDFYNKTIGYIEDLPNGDQLLKDFYMKTVGRYVKAQDVTKDFYGRTVAKGNQLTMLLGLHMSKEELKKSKL